MSVNLRDKWRKAFSAKRNRELLTFSLFLLFAVLLWIANNMQRTIEADISIPISYESLPEDVVIGNTLLPSLRVTLRDEGFVLYRYALHPSALAVNVNLMEWKHHSGIAHIPLSSLKEEILAKAEPSTEVLRISPDTLTVYYIDTKSKEVPVRLLSDIGLSKQYMLVGEPTLTPSTVSVQAPKALLDTITHVETELLTVNDFRDSAVFSVSLKAMEGVHFSTEEIDVAICSEQFTETALSVPIIGINIPKGYQLRTFPSSVNVTFLVRESQYSQISATDFQAQIDFKESDSETDGILQKVSLTRCPPYAIRPQISPDRVESLIEKKVTK